MTPDCLSGEKGSTPLYRAMLDCVLTNFWAVTHRSEWGSYKALVVSSTLTSPTEREKKYYPIAPIV